MAEVIRLPTYIREIIRELSEVFRLGKIFIRVACWEMYDITTTIYSELLAKPAMLPRCSLGLSRKCLYIRTIITTIDCRPYVSQVSNGPSMSLKNKNLRDLPEDHLYHIGLSNVHDDLPKLFGDVRFVCFGGQASRMEQFAKFINRELNINLPILKNYACKTDRYVVYKAGPVLSVSHGIGMASLSVVFQEIAKLVYYAGCKDVEFFRIGTSGGIGLAPGTVVVSEKAVNGSLEPVYKTVVLGNEIERPAIVDKKLVDELCDCSRNTDEFKTVRATTLSADDFYEGQGRTDGAFCDHGNEDKMTWLHRIHSQGVKNIEMEAVGFIAMCNRVNIPGAVCCVTLLDRFEGDGVSTDVQLLHKWQTYPQIIVARHIRRKLKMISNL